MNAVWNGQEALDYLMQPESSDHPKPDVILMDVQMPVMDGYIATHTIRHTAPFMDNKHIQNTPIVAMTASAIQGDREKCETAGMNDYLAKPVKGKILESMLVKWANARRKSLMSLEAGMSPKLQQTFKSHKGQSKLEPPIGKGLRPSAPPPSLPSLPSPALVLEEPNANPNKLTSKLDKLNYASKSALERSAETPDTRAMRHLHNEEKAMQLRDEQLMGSSKQQFNRGQGRSEEARPRASTQKLTRENIKKLSDDKEGDSARGHTRMSDEETSSLAVGADDASLRPRSTRPTLGDRVQSDSEKTVLAEW